MAHLKKKFLSQVFDNVFRLLSKELLFPFSAHQGPILRRTGDDSIKLILP